MDEGQLEEVRRRYAAERPVLDDLAVVAQKELQALAASAGVVCHVSVRTKDVASLLKKVIYKRYDDPWAEVTDKVGARVTVQRPSDVDRICAAVANASPFEVIDIIDKRSHEPGQFDYSGVHLRTRLRGGSSLEEVEVQLRTGAQDVWSDLSHTLLYKPTVAAPPPIRHAVIRIMALVELIDEEVERMMTKLEAEPGYDARRLHRIAETEYVGFAAEPSSTPMSIDMLDALLPTFREDELAGYAVKLHTFVGERRPMLEQMFSDYGPRSSVADEPAYVMLSQPETLVFLERLTEVPDAAVERWKPLLPALVLRTLVTLSGEDVFVDL